MIRFIVHWRLLFRTRERTKAEKLLERVRHAFDVPIELSVFEPYWKDEDLWECSFSIKVAGGSDAEIAFTCLNLANRLGNGWYLLGPGGKDPLQIFEGIFNANSSSSVTIMGVDWASFSLAPRDGDC